MVSAPAQVATGVAAAQQSTVSFAQVNAIIATAMGSAGIPGVNVTAPSFPVQQLGIRVDLNLGGTWTDITRFVYQRNPVQITNVGRADWTSTLQAASLTLTVNNRDGRFTPKNPAGAYYPNIIRNTQIRVFLSATSGTGLTYSGFRFYGEVTEWPPHWDPSGREASVDMVASGIWRRMSQLQTTLGSAFRRFIVNGAASTTLRSYWPMEDSAGSGYITPYGSVAGTPNGIQQFIGGQTGLSFASSNDFRGSDGIPVLNAALATFTVPAGGTPTNNVVRFVISVPAAGDSASGTTNWNLVEIDTAGTVAKFELYLNASGTLLMQGRNSSGVVTFSGTTTTSVKGTPYLVSMELTPGVAFALRIISQGAPGITESVTGSLGSGSVGAVTKVVVSRANQLTDTAFGHLNVAYGTPTSLVQAAGALNGYVGERALDRFTRICGEMGIASATIGTSSSSAAMGPQLDDTLANVLQSIEDTDCGLLYELRDTFGMGYRTGVSMVNQVPSVVFNYAAAVIDASLTPAYDDALSRNNITVTNWTGYTQQAILTAGPMSVLNPPNGIGNGYAYTRSVNAAADSQVPGIATFLLNTGANDEVRYPVVTVKMIRPSSAQYFVSVPGLDIGDYFQITNMPGFTGGGTSMTAVNGTSQALGHTEPEVRLFAGTYYCYYRDDNSGHGRIHLMTSSDGATWTESGSNPMLDVTAAAWDSSYVISPSVWFDGSTYYMFYEGNNGSFSAIGYATASAPGGPWTKFGSNPILSKQGTGFESVLVGTPAVIVISGTWYLFYHGYNGTNDQVALAWASTPSGTWTRHPSNPIIPVGNWFGRKVAPSSVWLGADNAVYIALEGDPGSGKFSIGVAQVPAANLQTAVPALTGGSQYAPMLSASVAGQDNDYVQLPCLVSSAGGQLWLYYSGHSTGGAFRMFRTDVSLTTAATTTTKQLMWGYSETLNAKEWTFAFNSVPETAWETAISPGTIQTAQIPGGSPTVSTAPGSGLGQVILNGSITPAMLNEGISIRTLGGSLVTISVGAPANPNTNDIWINSGTGLISQWNGSAWAPILFNATNTIQAGTIISSLIAAHTIVASNIAAGTITAAELVAGLVVAGIVDATTVQALNFIATGTQGEFLAYAGTPGSTTLASVISGRSGSDAYGTSFAAGVEVKQGGLVLDNQSGSPGATSGASTFYSSVLGRPRYISSVGDDSALERSQVSQTNITMTTQTIATAISPALTVQSDEANVGSEFEIEIEGVITAPTGGTAFVNNAVGPLYTVQMMIDGSVTGGVVGWGGVYLIQGSTFSFNCTCRLSIEATGAGGTCTISTWGTIQQQGPNVGNVMTGTTVEMSQPFSSLGTGKAIDTTTSHTLKIFGFWASVTNLTGHKCTVYRSKTARRM